MNADQDIIDYLSAIQHEGALHSQRQHEQQNREAWAARARARLN